MGQPYRNVKAAPFCLKNIIEYGTKPTTMLTVFHFPKNNELNTAPTTKVKSNSRRYSKYAKTYYKYEISKQQYSYVKYT